MRRTLLYLVGFLVVFGGAVLVAAGAGFYAHKLQFEPVFSFAEKAEGKIRKEIGAPSKTVGLVESINTAFLRFRGTVYTMPDRDFQNGGALSLWGEDTLVMHKSGMVFYLDEDKGMIKTDLEVPDNGKGGYAELAASEKYAGRQTRIDAMRYNDIEYIEMADRRGMALSYTFVDAANECYRTRISWVDIPASVSTIRDFAPKAEDWRTLYETSPCLDFNEKGELLLAYMAGGRIAFKGPNLLYLGSGEYHLEGIYRPDVGIQDPNVDYGKTIEINIETGEGRVYSIGHRNTQGVTVDTKGRLWVTEHGMRGGDELNLVLEGENYGWPRENVGTLYSGVPAPSDSGPGRHETFRAPIYAWLPSAATSSLATIDGFHETWDGDLLVGGLRSRTLFRIRIQDDRLVYAEPIPIGQRIRDVMQVGPKKIALWLDTLELVILEIDERENPLDSLQAGLSEELGPDLAGQAHEVLVGCNECHAFEKDIHGIGPSLASVFGANIASSAFGQYTEALQNEPGTWDEATLTEFLRNPGERVEGTAMAGFNIEDPELLRGVVRSLQWLSEQSEGIADSH